MKKLLLAAFALMLIAPTFSKAEEFNDAQKAEIKKLFEEFLSESGEKVLKSVNDYQAKLSQKQEEEAKEKAAEFSEKLKDNTELPMAGNPKGDVTMVEFFDYNCGYCRKALEELKVILETDENLKVIFMDMPILGPSSLTAAKWSLAAHKQGKYFEYHQALMDHDGQKDVDTLEKLAKDVDLDVKKMKEDAESDDVKKILDENLAAAASLNIRGTPGFVIDSQIFPGFLQRGRIRTILKDIRAEKE